MGKVTDECNIVGGSKDSKGMRKFNGREELSSSRGNSVSPTSEPN